jgi:hypothetical protein
MIQITEDFENYDPWRPLVIIKFANIIVIYETLMTSPKYFLNITIKKENLWFLKKTNICN